MLNLLLWIKKVRLNSHTQTRGKNKTKQIDIMKVHLENVQGSHKHKLQDLAGFPVVSS